MRSTLVAAAAGFGLLLALALNSPVAISGENDDPIGFKGVVIYTDGRRVPFEYVGDESGPMSARVIGRRGDQVMRYWLRELSRVDALSGSLRGGKDGALISVTGPTGVSVELKRAFLQCDRGNNLMYVHVDPITGTRRTAAHSFESVQAIEIGTQKGRIRTNAFTGRSWPPHYLYDPLDGTRLEWADGPTAARSPEPGARRRACAHCRLLGSATDTRCPQCEGPMLTTRGAAAARGVDYFIGRARLDPASREAAVAKRLASAWLNPFSSEEEIEAALADVVRAVGE